MAKRRPLVAGNWKMNGSRMSALSLADDLKAGALSEGVDIAVCPVSVHLTSVLDALQDTNIVVGGQDCSMHTGPGAYTGEVSAAMLQDIGCGCVIVGHSEWRALFSKTDAVVVAKLRCAQQAGLLPILCVGETLEERDAGRVADVLAVQIGGVIDGLGVAALANMVVAYEPIWAIGTGRTASPQQAQEAHALIRAQVAAHDTEIAEGLRILYGGSMKPDNAEELMAQADVDGGLIGGASLKADDFLAICRAAA